MLFRSLYAADFLRRHASSKERLPFIRRYYQEIFSGLPPIRSILDLGCGLNPIAAVSFIPNGRDLHYTAVDLPLDLVDFLNDFFQFLDLSGTALQGNLLNGAPDIDADLTLIPPRNTIIKGSMSEVRVSTATSTSSCHSSSADSRRQHPERER